MKEYLAIFSLLGLTLGIIVFTWIYVHDLGMSYQYYRIWISILLSFLSLISNAAIAYYFSKRYVTSTRRSRKTSQ
jgi:hypothetical protein